MRPAKSPAANVYLLQDDTDRLYYKQSGESLTVTLGNGSYLLYQVDEKTGTLSKPQNIKKETTLKGKGVYLIRKK